MLNMLNEIGDEFCLVYMLKFNSNIKNKNSSCIFYVYLVFNKWYIF